MKKLLFTSIFIFTVMFLFAQSPLPKGQMQLNAGIGLSDWGIPIYIGLDYSVHDDISIGGELSYRSADNNNWNNKNYSGNVLGIHGNGNYHFNTLLSIPSEWDFYAGLNLGFYSFSNSNYNSGVGLGAQIGGRYYFNQKIGINLEFGGGNLLSGGKFGVSIRL